jgi:hypothetical protein
MKRFADRLRTISFPNTDYQKSFPIPFERQTRWLIATFSIRIYQRLITHSQKAVMLGRHQRNDIPVGQYCEALIQCSSCTESNCIHPVVPYGIHRRGTTHYSSYRKETCSEAQAGSHEANCSCAL